MSQETYQQLRQEFQELRHQYEQSTGPRFCIKICVPGYSSTAEPPYDPKKFQPIASVSLPFEAGYVPSPVQDDQVGILGVALAPKAKATKDAVTRFIELSRTAGENLPGDITHSLKGLSSDLMDDPISKWLALLIVLNDCHRGNSVIIRPFLNSIEAIDRCKLGTAQASLYPPKPATSGRKRKKPKETEQERYERHKYEDELAAEWRKAHEDGTCKADFAQAHDMSEKEFDKLLDRVAGRKRTRKKNRSEI